MSFESLLFNSTDSARDTLLSGLSILSSFNPFGGRGGVLYATSLMKLTAR